MIEANNSHLDADVRDTSRVLITFLYVSSSNCAKDYFNTYPSKENDKINSKNKLRPTFTRHQVLGTMLASTIRSKTSYLL